MPTIGELIEAAKPAGAMALVEYTPEFFDKLSEIMRLRVTFIDSLKCCAERKQP
jgi:hypothetical protein